MVINISNKQRIICDLTEKCYNSGKYIVLHTDNEDEGKRYDNLLWTWKQSSFIPHVYTKTLSDPFDESVVISNQIKKNPKYDILLMDYPASLDVIKQFNLVIDFAEKYDLARLKKSRERYKLYQQEKMKVTTMQPGEFFHADIDQYLINQIEPA